MRKFKTSKKNRTTYIYYFEDGTTATLTPNQNGIDEASISFLHQQDDLDCDANRREDYKCPVHFEMLSDKLNENADDVNPLLADTAPDPLQMMIEQEEQQEHQELLQKLNTAMAECLSEEQRTLIHKKFYLGMTNVAIAAEEKVTEAAIRNRLNRIYAKLKKFLLN